MKSRRFRKSKNTGKPSAKRSTIKRLRKVSGGRRRGRGRPRCPECGSYDYTRYGDYYNGEYWACQNCGYSYVPPNPSYD